MLSSIKAIKSSYIDIIIVMAEETWEETYPTLLSEVVYFLQGRYIVPYSHELGEFINRNFENQEAYKMCITRMRSGYMVTEACFNHCLLHMKIQVLLKSRSMGCPPPYLPMQMHLKVHSIDEHSRIPLYDTLLVTRPTPFCDSLFVTLPTATTNQREFHQTCAVAPHATAPIRRAANRHRKRSKKSHTKSQRQAVPATYNKRFSRKLCYKGKHR